MALILLRFEDDLETFLDFSFRFMEIDNGMLAPDLRELLEDFDGMLVADDGCTFISRFISLTPLSFLMASLAVR